MSHTFSHHAHRAWNWAPCPVFYCLRIHLCIDWWDGLSTLVLHVKNNSSISTRYCPFIINRINRINTLVDPFRGPFLWHYYFWFRISATRKKRPVSIRLDPKEIIAIYLSCVNPRSLVKSSQVSLLNANIKQERDDESGICCFNCPPYMYLTCVQFQLHVLCIQSIKLCGRLDFTLLILLSSTSFASVFYKQERVDERLSTRSNQVWFEKFD